MFSQDKLSSAESLNFYNPHQDKPDCLFSTNNVLIQKIPHESKHHPKQVIVYLPGYLRVKAKNINEIHLTNLTSNINMDLIYNIYFGDLFQSDDRFQNQISKSNKDGQTTTFTYEQSLRQLFQTDFKLNFSRGGSVLLAQLVNEEENLEIKVKTQNENQIGFTVRKVLSLHMDGNIWLSPFELLNSILEITVQPLTFKLMETKYTFRINLMNHPDCDIKLSFPENSIKFGKYQLAKNMTRSAYTNKKIAKSKELDMSYEQHEAYLERKNAKNARKTLDQYRASTQIEKDIKYFQYAYFNLPIYKHPIDTIITAILPIWLLGVINLGIFFQDENLNDRLGSIIGLVVALIFYIPTIEQTIPPTPNLVMAKLMVYLEITAVICLFIHSMRVKFETNFRLDWKETPEYWIAFLILVLSAATVIILTIIHYAYWKRLYNNPHYYDERRKGRMQWKTSKAKLALQIHQQNQRLIYNNLNYSGEWQERKQIQLKKSKILLYEMEPRKQTSMAESFQTIILKQPKRMKFQKQDWSNLECDLYFNRFFVVQGRKSKHSKLKQQNPDYFIITPRQFALTIQQVLQSNFRKQSQPSAQVSSTSHLPDRKPQIDESSSREPRNITSFPLVHISQKNPSKIHSKRKSNPKQVSLYLPGYMRMKFKNFNSLDFENLGGDLNATMILTVYYGGIFKYLQKEFGLNSKHEEAIIQKMKNEFVLFFQKDDALQLTEGKMVEDYTVKQNWNQVFQTGKYHTEDSTKNVKKIRNIDLTIKEDPSKKALHFAIRRIFQIHLQSHVFLTPIEKLKASINVTINSIKMSLGTNKLQKITINVNLIDTTIKQDKISISEVKKFSRYGLILPELDVAYYNNKLQVDEDSKWFWEKGSFWDKREAHRKKENWYQRVFEDVQRVFVQEKYKSLRAVYRSLGQKDERVKQYFEKRNFSLNQTNEQQSCIQLQKQDLIGQLGRNSSYEPFKYVSFKLPLYKFPFDSIATIFFPLWLLGLLNLGIFFQTESFGERVISIASLLIAFISFIPIIRSRIPPSPSITLVEYLVAALLFTCLLTLGQSMDVRFQNEFQFVRWGQDAWFLVALIITVLTFGIVIVLMAYHYVVLQPNYKWSLPQENKFKRSKWFNRHDKCQEYTKDLCSFKEVYSDSQNPQNLVYKIQYKKDSRAQDNASREFRPSYQAESSEQKQGFVKRWLNWFGEYWEGDTSSDGQKGKGTDQSGTLKELKNKNYMI